MEWIGINRLTAVEIMGVGTVATALGIEHVLMREKGVNERLLGLDDDLHACTLGFISARASMYPQGTVLSFYLSIWTGLDWFCTESDWIALD